MKNNPLVSIIVPVYNVDKYIDKCLESITSQSYEKIEIILINDASTDDSLLRCEAWASKDKRIKVVNKMVNEGLLRARITGFDKMVGSYFMTIDSDDIIEHKFVESYLEKALFSKANIVVSDSFTRLYENGQKQIVKFPQLYNKSHVFDNLIKNISKSQDKFGWNVWGKMYDTEIYKKSRMYLRKIKSNINAGEDIIFSFIFAYHAHDSEVIINYAGYYYRQNSQSIMHRVQHESFIRKIDSVTNVMFYVEQFLTSVNLNKKYQKQINEFKDYLISDNIWAIKNEYNRINNELQQQINSLQEYNNELQQQINSLQEYNNELQQQINSLLNSRAYKLGRGIVAPYLKVKKRLYITKGNSKR